MLLLIVDVPFGQNLRFLMRVQDQATYPGIFILLIWYSFSFDACDSGLALFRHLPKFTGGLFVHDSSGQTAASCYSFSHLSDKLTFFHAGSPFAQD
jgi:hypothetical protein